MKSLPGTVMHEFYIEEQQEGNNGKITMFTFHRFSNAKAAVKHVEEETELPQMADHVDYKCVRLLGHADVEVMEVLKKFNPVKFTYVCGIKPIVEDRAI